MPELFLVTKTPTIEQTWKDVHWIESAEHVTSEPEHFLELSLLELDLRFNIIRQATFKELAPFSSFIVKLIAKFVLLLLQLQIGGAGTIYIRAKRFENLFHISLKIFHRLVNEVF